MVSPELADHPAVVVSAYLAIFLPWTAVCYTDFINSRWKPVRTTLREGRLQLVCILIPSVYIMFYVYIQAYANDYKEMSAAIVGLFFSLIHLGRTIIGIVHVLAFRDWAVQSVKAMECWGIPYIHSVDPKADGAKGFNSLRVKTGNTIGWEKKIANELLINDSIVDNVFSGTQAVCRIVYADKYQGGGLMFSAASSLLARLCQLVVFLFLPVRFIFDTLISSVGLGRGKRSTLRIEPVKPISVFLNWSAAFVAQGLGGWVSEFSVAENIKEKEKNLEDWGPFFEKQRDYFAGEVLASASMQAGRGGNILVWGEEWKREKKSDVNDGRVTKGELLKWVMMTGIGMPFGAPQTNIRGEIPIDGYGVCRNNLRRIVEELPPCFGIEGVKFDIDMLEWFAIYLGVGVGMVKRGRGQERTGKSAEANGDFSGDDVSSLGDEGEIEGVGNREELESGDLAVENLEVQLGFPRGRLSGTVDPVSSICRRVSVPLKAADVAVVSRSNRLVLEAGEFIDIWVALVSGEQVEFLLSKDESWTERCLGRNIAMMGSGLLDSQSSSESNTVSGCGKNTSLGRVHADLKITSLEFQYANIGQRYWHLEHTLTFMGYDMEYVRSELERWVKQSSRTEEDRRWLARIPYDSNCHSMTSKSVLAGNLSSGFAEELLRCEEKLEYLERRSVQVRLIWEARGLLQQKLMNSDGGPASSIAMLLCLLAFPALSVKVAMSSQEEQVEPAAETFGNSLLPMHVSKKSADEDPTDNKALQTFTVSVQPRCGPQRLGVSLRFHCSGSIVRVKASLERHLRVEDERFHWEWWRDSFCGRLDGLAEWQKTHQYVSADIRWTHDNISTGIRCYDAGQRGTGKNLPIWKGWLPFRVRQCRAELASPGFLLEYREGQKNKLAYKSPLDEKEWTVMIPRQKRVEVTYSAAKRERLRHACFVIEEILAGPGDWCLENASKKSNCEMGEQMLSHASSLLAKTNGRHIDRALFFLEIAVYEHGNLAALKRFVQVFLSDQKEILRTLPDVLNLLSRFSYSLFNHSSTILPATLMSTTFEIFEIYSLLMHNPKLCHSPLLIRHFTTWTDILRSTNLRVDTAYWLARIRNAFTRSQNFDMLTTLGEVCHWHNNNMASHSTCSPISSILQPSLYERAAYQGEQARALFNLANLYRDGTPSMPQDLGKASLLHQKAVSEHQFVPAMVALGVLLSSPRFPNANLQTAVHMYRQAIYLRADIDAMFNLANVLKCGGNNVAANVGRAVELYSRAAEEGHTGAMVNLAAVLYEGEFVERDVEGAIKLLERATEEGGEEVGMYNLGVILKARGLQGDLKKGMNMFKRAGRVGHVGAMVELGDVLSEGGEGVERELLGGLESYLKAAEKGNRKAMVRAGDLLMIGKGEVSRDLKGARMWYERALVGGGPVGEKAGVGLGLVEVEERWVGDQTV